VWYCTTTVVVGCNELNVLCSMTIDMLFWTMLEGCQSKQLIHFSNGCGLVHKWYIINWLSFFGCWPVWSFVLLTLAAWPCLVFVFVFVLLFWPVCKVLLYSTPWRPGHVWSLFCTPWRPGHVWSLFCTPWRPCPVWSSFLHPLAAWPCLVYVFIHLGHWTPCN